MSTKEEIQHKALNAVKDFMQSLRGSDEDGLDPHIQKQLYGKAVDSDKDVATISWLNERISDPHEVVLKLIQEEKIPAEINQYPDVQDKVSSVVKNELLAEKQRREEELQRWEPAHDDEDEELEETFEGDDEGRKEQKAIDSFLAIMDKAAETRSEKNPATKRDKIDKAIQSLIVKHDFVEHGIGIAYVRELLTTAADTEYSSITHGEDFMRYRGYRIAHRTDIEADEPFNSFVWSQEGGDRAWAWRPAANIVLKATRKIDKSKEFSPTARLAVEIAKQLSTADDTLRVTYDESYARELNGIVIDHTGHYYDIDTGMIREIDPSRQFFETADVSIPLKAISEDKACFEASVQVFEAFLLERFGPENWEIVRDHLASVFLSGKMLKSKPKLLEIVGVPNTWKSFLIEYLASMLVQTAVSNVSLKQMDSDSVFGPATIINRRLNYSEETAPELPRNQSVLKDLITKEMGSARGMRSTKSIPAYRWPRWILAANKMQPLGTNDDNDSMFIRMIIVEALPNPKDQPDWRQKLNEHGVRQWVMMYLLSRATMMHKHPECMKTQNVEQTQKEFERLRTDDLSLFIDANCDRTAADIDENEHDVGIELTWFWHWYKRDAKTNITRAEMKDRLETMDFEIASRDRCEPYRDLIHTYKHSTDIASMQRTLILGLKTKRDVGKLKTDTTPMQEADRT